MTAPTATEDVRAQVRSWLAEHWDPNRPIGEWWELLAESGWAFPRYPVEWSGRGLSADDERIVAEGRREKVER